MHTEDVEFLEAQYMVVSEAIEYQQVQTSHVDPTVDSDNDFEEAPLSDELVACVGLGECGASGRVEFTAADAEHILRVSRSSGKAIPNRGDVGSADVDHSDFTKLHPLVFWFAYAQVCYDGC